MMVMRAFCLPVFAAAMVAFGNSGSAIADPPSPIPPGAPQAPPASDPFGNNPPRLGNGADPLAPQADPFQQPSARNRVKQTPLLTTEEAVQNSIAKSVNTQIVEQRIRAALDDETTHSFIEQPLSDAIAILSRAHKIPMVIDNRALDEIGISSEDTVTLSLEKVSLRSFLRLLLRDLALTYVINDETLQITTLEAAENDMPIRLHRLDSALAADKEAVVKAIQLIDPNTWDVVGGPSSVVVVGDTLVVAAKETTHEKVNKLLEELTNTSTE
ncbi:hypothetical protein N9N28_01285 [Rubripirellula amarantea]|uniref:Uncharacterized protein n=1 Tax=Rubripirellula amarantea TaxID=2527999 RepID=A0A5C5WFG9_9BACT|nr:hypothetical protein [Rubripirellula amarantea]MDA8743239.1 hypothetical protein [Rubripirellula amarantea]TWT49504.1 hypothetical protein Pla22_47010 [Rubripirellula amarantea]